MLLLAISHISNQYSCFPYSDIWPDESPLPIFSYDSCTAAWQLLRLQSKENMVKLFVKHFSHLLKHSFYRIVFPRVYIQTQNILGQIFQ